MGNSLVNKKFQTLIKDSIEYVKAAKRKKINFDTILSDLYNDPSHFIYEILQNAEDAGAKSITFNLLPDLLEIHHDANKNFIFEDVEGITGIGLSTKADDLNKIGKFGVGFKSVFAITRTPSIESGDYHFNIKDFVIPEPLTSNGIKGTKINLPFNHPVRGKEEVYSLIENKLQDIGLKTLLFLSNIKEIKWKTLSKKGHYLKSVNSFENVNSTKRVSIISQTVDEEYFEEYLVIQKLITIDSKELIAEIAYKLKSDEDNIEKIVSVPNQESKLVVYFPTEKVTYLNFIIQGPFRTTPNRENIPLDDNQNEVIIEKIADLVAESIPIIKKLNLLSINFLEVLPIDDKNCDEPIYSTIFNKVKEKLLSEDKLLPTNHGSYSDPNNSILARGKVLTKLLKTKDIKLLFDKSHWLDTNITADLTRELRDYIINELDVDEVNMENFSKNITEKFMKSKNDDWIIYFYSVLINKNTFFRERTQWNSEGVLRYKPIIRLKNNKHSPIFDSAGKIQVYLPTKTKSSYKTVKSSIAKDETALAFLKYLGISKPDVFAEINEFILPKYKGDAIDINDKEYYQDIDKIISALSTKKSSDKKTALIQDLKKLEIINSINPVTGENDLMIPSQVYLNNHDLRLYFEGSDAAYFINKNLYNRFGQKDFEKFALLFGCKDSPKRIQIESKLTWQEKVILHKNRGYARELHTWDYNYDGLENVINDMNIDKSAILYKLLLKSISDYRFNKYDFFNGEYSWSYHRAYIEPFDSNFKKILCKVQWLYDKNGKQVRSNEIAISELADDYLVNEKYSDILEKVLGFQLDEIKKIEEKTGGKFLTAEQNTEYEKLKLEKKLQEESGDIEDNDWEPDVTPEEVETSISEGMIETIISEDLSNQKISGNGIGYKDNDGEKDNSDDESDGIPKKKIGDWGEKYVFMDLKNKRFFKLNNYQDTELGFSGKDQLNNIIEVRWLNRNNDIGKGYDFVILENDVETEYIEVKTTTKPGKTLHRITGTQWEFARKLFLAGDGEKYKIYVVKNAFSHDAECKFISNPIKHWVDGKLYAQAINFRL